MIRKVITLIILLCIVIPTIAATTCVLTITKYDGDIPLIWPFRWWCYEDGWEPEGK